MPMGYQDVHAAVDRCAAPTLKRLGLKRLGRRFIQRAAGGREIVLEFWPDVFPDGVPAFTFDYGVVVPAHQEWLAAQGLAVRKTHHPSEGLVFAQAFHPVYESGAEWADIFVYRWRLDDRFGGPALATFLPEYLAEVVLPRVQSWVDPAQMVAEIRREEEGVFVKIDPPAAGVALALVDEGPSAQLSAALEALEPDNRVRTWVETRLLAQR
jgi:hypothetical protein